MTTVKELFDYAIDYDLKLVAHTIYWALQQGAVTLYDNAANMQQITLDTDVIEKWTSENRLAIGKTLIYVIETTTPRYYAFYYAEDVVAAVNVHRALFGEQPRSVHNGSRLLTKVMYFYPADVETCFVEYRKRFVQFPAYIGHAWAGERVLVETSR